MPRGVTRRAELCGLLLPASGGGQAASAEGRSDNLPDWFYPAWAAKAPYRKPIVVRDTERASTRYSLKTKELGLRDLGRVHGRVCDGLVIALIEVKAATEKLFPEGVVDRTGLRAFSKNGPCWVDAVMMMTGARVISRLCASTIRSATASSFSGFRQARPRRYV